MFHDDQHGTAIVALAALTNALRVVGKQAADVRIVMSGAGAAGTAILDLFLYAGARDVVVCDVHGVVEPSRPDIEPGSALARVAAITNPRGVTGTLRGALAGADVFLGVSAPGILDGADIATMADDSIVFAMANPDPEVDPVAAAEHAAVVATGRSDFANQINNVLAFPGVFRGLLDAQSTTVDAEVLLAAARALAATVKDDEPERDLHRAERLPPRRHEGGGGGRAAGRRAVRSGQAPARPARRHRAGRGRRGAGRRAHRAGARLLIRGLLRTRPARHVRA
ncbi:hypothetical protein GCM10025868_11590 [Angustibacter aerolatus]|uniref:Malic enzyme NAD-binding domain-containing protein n=1 Tax=Angustibacter aerolatus TaxID=1162965 RepID=A0ABQ6JFJ0_9ACTN|nr:hypothetical protein GCM10025868_11590 [Angustibacter aerolatus]